jgi:hypothetical protein
MSGNVIFIFKRALCHYIQVLEKLKDDQEIQFSNDIFRQDIQSTIKKIDEMINGLDSTDPIVSVERNRELMCSSLHSYISDLEKMKGIITSKLQNSDTSLPAIEFNNVNQELEIAKRIQTKSCIEHGF